MNLQTVKKTEARGVKLQGVNIEMEWHDSGLYAVTLTDANGRVLKMSSAYGMTALTPAPPEKKTMHVVKGTVRTINTPIREEFENDFEAQQRARELSMADLLDGAATVEKEEMEIQF